MNPGNCIYGFPVGCGCEYCRKSKKYYQCGNCGVFHNSLEENTNCSCRTKPEVDIIKESIFSEAEKLINGPRRQDYGPVVGSLEAAAHAFTAVLYHKLKSPIVAKEVALCMAAYKCVRESGGTGKRDNLVDICGYAGLVQVIAEKLTKQEGEK